MSRSDWSVIFAVVGWLALSAQAPKAKRITHLSPTVHTEPEHPGNDSAYQPAPTPIILTETPEQAVASEREKAETREHDARDLKAQIRAADAAENQVPTGWLAALFSGIGTLLIVWTLYETRKSNGIARKTYEATTKPFLAIELIDADSVIYDPIYGKIGRRRILNKVKRSPRIMCRIKSTGGTPVILTQIVRCWAPSRLGKNPPPITPENQRLDSRSTHIPIGADGIILRTISERITKGNPRDEICFYGFMRFQTIDGSANYVSGFYFRLCDGQGMVTAMPSKNAAQYWYHRKVKTAKIPEN